MKLKPCPFCGSQARYREHDGGEFVECVRCHATGTMMYPEKCDVRGLLAEHWNGREDAAGDVATAYLLDAIQKLLDTIDVQTASGMRPGRNNFGDAVRTARTAIAKATNHQLEAR